MEQPTQPRTPDSPENLRILESQIRECYGKVVWSHKIHEKSADIYMNRLNIIKAWQIILSALTAGSLLVVLFNGAREGVIIGSAFSTLLLALNIYMKDYNLGELAQKHVDTANRLWDVRESYCTVLTDMATGYLGMDGAGKKRDELQNYLGSIYRSAPRTGETAYKSARKALNVNQENTFSDEEIDAFLPEPLRRTKKN